MFFNIIRFDISDLGAAALANGFLTDFGVLRADSLAQQRINPQEIAHEKVRISTKLEKERNTDVYSGNQSVNQLDIKVEENVMEDSDTMTKLEQEGNVDIHIGNQSISYVDIKREFKMEENDVEDMLTSPDLSLTVKSGNNGSFFFSTIKQ